jgi:hypothetical protein
MWKGAGVTGFVRWSLGAFNDDRKRSANQGIEGSWPFIGGETATLLIEKSRKTWGWKWSLAASLGRRVWNTYQAVLLTSRHYRKQARLTLSDGRSLLVWLDDPLMLVK